MMPRRFSVKPDAREIQWAMTPIAENSNKFVIPAKAGIQPD
jgi:hypothetical protein